jgi:cation transport regulator ChaC
VINETALKDALLALAEQCKTQYLGLSIVIDEIAALREAVRGLDPTFSEVLAQKRKEAASDDIRRAAIRQFDEIIERLRAGEVCE